MNRCEHNNTATDYFSGFPETRAIKCLNCGEIIYQIRILFFWITIKVIK